MNIGRVQDSFFNEGVPLLNTYVVSLARSKDFLDRRDSDLPCLKNYFFKWLSPK